MNWYCYYHYKMFVVSKIHGMFYSQRKSAWNDFVCIRFSPFQIYCIQAIDFKELKFHDDCSNCCFMIRYVSPINWLKFANVEYAFAQTFQAKWIDLNCKNSTLISAQNQVTQTNSSKGEEKGLTKTFIPSIPLKIFSITASYFV